MRLLIAETKAAAYADSLAEMPGLDITVAETQSEVTAGAAVCEIWLGAPDLLVEPLRRGLRPRWLQSTWAGITPLLAEGLPRDYLLSRAVGVFGQVISEYALTYMLANERQLLARLDSQRAGHWDTTLPGTLAGKCVLIVGTGDIGSAIAQLLRGFGCELLGISRQLHTGSVFDRTGTLEALPTFAARADYVINLLPDTSRTRDVYNAAFFQEMKPSALFINVGRGGAVVENDLVAALEQGHLAGAVLDVFRQEPLPHDHPFWSAPNLVITGHVAGPTLVPLMSGLFKDNVRRLQTGEDLRGQVDFNRGY
ncbi:D-2-hydroxyacid dehydrogenase [Pseudomonas matsuisoli]|uniref:2-hydroxyacid dehydrogenase n=1 Tax=Pseudomonas matsuisoli TaxID=1515666 RepID=A0A917PT24_9PSED|nr:D-2-hydroxyacid dehydrogenase [Pseudomonas matsuisoli]GGJ90290.1 2-hydroxyacid dehydrogenase [Pseudomonas matsuisoli]